MNREGQSLKVAFLVGGDTSSTRRSIEAVCRLPGIQPVAILRDTATVPFKRRWKNLLRNYRLNGWKYPFVRMLDAIRTVTDNAIENAIVSRAEVLAVLRKAFPDRCYSLADLEKKYGMKVHAVGNLNSAQAAKVLAECGVDLGIVLGTRILKPGTFNVPRLGSINLHKGKVPEYRGMPPGFWELYDGAPSAGVTVHFVDAGLDTGDIVATGTVPIAPMETPDSLAEKLNQEGERVLAVAVAAIRDGSAAAQPQSKGSFKARTKPTLAEMAAMRRKVPHWKQPGALSRIFRNVYLLALYYLGIYFLIRKYHQLRGSSRAAIYLHHRVNDYSKDVLTVDTETFAAQLLAISKYYPFSSTEQIVDAVRNRKPLPPTTVAIHFDDCYRDILTNGAPIMKALGVPACAFINSGFIDTTRTFAHDRSKYPFTYEMLRSSEVQEWSHLGFEIGAHTVNHVDLGQYAGDEAKTEIVVCGEALQSLVGKPVDLFSFPFGGVKNITAPNRQIIADSGYQALFSAHGGFVGPRTDRYDIPRLGCSYESTALYCLLEIEGLALYQIMARIRPHRPRQVR